MRIVGIVCEYNPFHSGHRRQFDEIRRLYGEDCAIVCAMSGNFVQRGDFAIMRKHTRAEAALRQGADLVLEIPLPYAIASAERFARGAIAVLLSCGIVDTLSFGSECGDTAMLMTIAKTIDSAAYQEQLRAQLATGISYAAGRATAVGALLGEPYAAVLDGANNNLGVEYCRALRYHGAEMELHSCKRYGAAHDSQEVGVTASASQIRQMLLAGADVTCYLSEDTLRLYAAEATAGRAPVTIKNAERAMLACFRSTSEEIFARFDEGGEGLYHRLYRASREACSLEELLTLSKSKRYAHARLRRMLLARYLHIEPQYALRPLPYLRVLGAAARGRALLHRMRETAALPIITKPANVRQMGKEVQDFFALEVMATDLYTLAYPAAEAAAAGSEWRIGAVML